MCGPERLQGHLAEHGVNPLGQRFGTEAPDQVWTGDLTYITTDEGLAVPGRIEGPVFGRNRRLRAGRAHDTALGDAGPVPGRLAAPPPLAVIQHTDRGSQDCSHEYRALVAWSGTQAAIPSAKDSCLTPCRHT